MYEPQSQAEERAQYWRDLLGEELRARLIEEVHRDLPKVKLELHRIRDRYRPIVEAKRARKAARAAAG